MERFKTKDKDELVAFIQADGGRRVCIAPASLFSSGTGLTGLVYVVAEGRRMGIQEMRRKELLILGRSKWRMGKQVCSLTLLRPRETDQSPHHIDVWPYVGPRASVRQQVRPTWLGSGHIVRAWATRSELTALAALLSSDNNNNDNNNPVEVM